MAPKRRRQTEEEVEEQEVPSASSADSERTATASENETDRSEDDDNADNDFVLRCRSGKDAEESEEEEEEEEQQQETRRVTAAKPRKRKQLETVKKPAKATKKQKKAEMTPIKKNTDKSPKKKQPGGSAKKVNRNPPLPRVSTMQQKCTLFSFYCCIEENKKKVPEESWELLRHTCFWDFIKCFLDGKIEGPQIRKQESDLELILKHYNKSRKCFVFGEKELRIIKDQVHQLFHISTKGINLKEAYSRMRNANSDLFKRKKALETIKRTVIETELENQLRKKNKDPKKIASLILMYLFAVFFFSTLGTKIK